MKTSRTARFALAAMSVAILSACGGGGGSAPAPATSSGGTSGGTSTPPATAAAPSPTAVNVSLVGMDIKTNDVLAQTATSSTVVGFLDSFLKRFMFDATSTFAGTAYANTSVKVNPGSNFGFTNKIQGGKLVTLNLDLRDANGALITHCDTSTAEARIHRLWDVHPGKGHMLGKLTVPSVINANCTVTYKDAMYVITSSGATVEVQVDGDQISHVLEAGDQAFNSSDTAVLVFKSGHVRTLAVADDGKVTLKTLTEESLPIKTGVGFLAYNGNWLVATSTQRSDVVLALDANSKAFKIISTAMGSPEIPASKYPGSGVMLDAAGNFVWLEYSQYMRQLNLSTNSYTEWTPAQLRVPGSYGVRGRFGEWVMSDRCLVWNTTTGAYNLLTRPGESASASVAVAEGATYARLEGENAFCVNGSGNIFSRLNVATNTMKHFNTDSIGYFFSAGRKFEMFKDKAMLWGAVSTANSDTKIIELNFDTGNVVDHGTIKTGDRKVTELVVVGG